MRRLVVALVVLVLSACAGTPYDRGDETGHASHRAAVAKGKIDYPYWSAYLRQHGEAETFAHFESVRASVEAADREALTASFERFCRFERCLEGYRAWPGESSN